jgi:hypothetical protein
MRSASGHEVDPSQDLPPISFAISQITDGQFDTTEYRSLHHALSAIEPILRDGRLILEGKPLRELWTPRIDRGWGQLGRLLPREDFYSRC